MDIKSRIQRLQEARDSLLTESIEDIANNDPISIVDNNTENDISNNWTKSCTHIIKQHAHRNDAINEHTSAEALSDIKDELKHSISHGKYPVNTERNSTRSGRYSKIWKISLTVGLVGIILAFWVVMKPELIQLNVPESHEIINVDTNSISVRWARPLGRYDSVTLICTNQGGYQAVVTVPQNRGNLATCKELESDTEYIITLATNMYGVESAVKIADLVKTKRGWMKMLSDNTYAIIGGVTIAVVAPYAAPVIIGAAGFTAGGIAAGSWAATLMSVAATSSGGGVAAGSLVALLQSAGAAGLGTVSSAAIAAIAGVVGASVGSTVD